MTRPTLLLLHGWGFDASLWDGLHAALPHYTLMRWDRGYFSAPIETDPDEPLVAIGHSLGAMLLAHRLPASVPLIAINGFDQFTGANAVPLRLLERMQSRFAQTPAEVLTEFRARCGAGPATGEICHSKLALDLDLLATGRVDSGGRDMLVLHGAEDAILPEILRATAFPGVRRLQHDEAGHLLPLTHPAWCAEQIENFLCK